MKIGIISDTHGHLPSIVLKVFEAVDLILHAGDIGNQDIISELEKIAPVQAVHGNIDDLPIRDIYPVTLDLIFNGIRICITHNIVNYQYFTFELFRSGRQPDIVIFGHTHKASFETYRHIKFLNPGSVYRPKGGPKKSVALIDVLNRDFEPEFVYWD